MRKQSPETQLRHVKAELKRQDARLNEYEAELRARRRYGAMLANISFNLAQGDKVAPELKAILDECRKAWDEIRSVSL